MTVKTWWRLSYPPANHVWFPGAWKVWWPAYKKQMKLRRNVRVAVRWSRPVVRYHGWKNLRAGR